MEENERKMKSASVHYKRIFSEGASLCERFISKEEGFRMKESEIVRLHLISKEFFDETNLESHCFAKSLSRRDSWKYRKKKPTHYRRSPLNEIASWKRQKKKSVLNRRSALREKASWKRRKKEVLQYKAGIHARLERLTSKKGLSMETKEKEAPHAFKGFCTTSTTGIRASL